MDITYLEREKKITMCLMQAVADRISVLNSQKCYRYLLNHPDTDIVNLIKIVHKAADHMQVEWHRDLIKDTMNVALAVCCRNEQYVKMLSKILSSIYGRDVNISCHKKFGMVDSALLAILMKVTNKLLKQSSYSIDEIHDILKSCTNGTVSFIHDESDKAMKEVLDEKEYDIIIPFFETMLYILYQDTAYRDPFFWILDKIARPELRKLIKPYVKLPKEWYVNIWFNSVKLTDEQQKKGIIPNYEHSLVERRMVPTKQNFDLNKKLRR